MINISTNNKTNIPYISISHNEMLQIIYNIIILIEKYTEHSANGSESVHLQGK
jgi:hypothetical protein